MRSSFTGDCKHPRTRICSFSSATSATSGTFPYKVVTVYNLHYSYSRTLFPNKKDYERKGLLVVVPPL